MLDHVSITVTDLARSAPFYDTVMAALGVPCVWRAAKAIGYGTRHGEQGYLTVAECPGVVADRRHWCFRAADRAAVRVGLGPDHEDIGHRAAP